MIQNFGKIRKMEQYHNTKGLSIEQVKAETGCHLIFNSLMFNPDGTPCDDLRHKGQTVSNSPYGYFGYGWNEKDTRPRLVSSANGDWLKYEEFATCYPLLMNGAELTLWASQDHKTTPRGQTACGFTENDELVVFCSTDTFGAISREALKKEMAQAGCLDAISWDGGRSSGCLSPSGNVYPLNDFGSSKPRIVRWYICVWLENQPEPGKKKYRVCLDPGHGAGEPNCSPDKSYIEYKFAFDMARRVKALLESTECFEVLITKAAAEATPTLAERARRANQWGADIFLSQHSNAVGGGGWNDSVHGLTVWTYAPGGTRERLANRLLDQYSALGVELFGRKLYNAKFAVLAHTNMPAVLIEHYFHTCRSDVKKLLSEAERETLAYAQARGICEFFNMDDNLIPVSQAAQEETQKDIVYRVQTGAFDDEANAKKMEAALKAQGYQTIIKAEEK